MSRLFPSGIRRAGSVSFTCCLLVGLPIPLLSLPAHAAVEVRGTSELVQVVAHNAKLHEVLSALAATLKSLNYRGTNLDGVINGTFKGSVQDVLGLILSGYDYVITTQDAAMLIVVIGRSASVAIAPALGTVAPIAPATPLPQVGRRRSILPATR
jgi:hypothetical protein